MPAPAGPDRPPTIRSVAERAGVSKSLVSLVLQGSPKVGEERRRAVLRAMSELGWSPDPVARSLAERRTRTVGVLLDDLRNPWSADLLDGTRPVLREHGLRPVLGDARTEPDLLRTLVGLRVDGLLVAGTVPGLTVDPLLAACAGVEAAPPLVVAGAREPVPAGVDVVADDGERGAHLAVEHLLALGHRRIAHVAGTGAVADVRRAAFEGRLREAGLEPVVAAGGLDEAGGHRAAAALLAGGSRPTAVVAVNDLAAVGVLAAAQEAGLRVPEDLSVVGYDNSSLARLRPLSLTSVDGAGPEVGRRAAALLLERLGGGRGPGRTVLVAPHLVVRGSTGPPPRR
ncbi:LacI family DNA-binding transcriptional regulator [Kineococcus glutinatus]|uniref:LacI family DNA-binding transcriptional regulator n=1 Tax=Kineococcus glutinatus TaxID=1070872 RepID=A0ABP8VCF8_9ACTN